jgi:hypothetical protein
MKAIKVSKFELVSILKAILREVEADDSWEGSFEYTCMDEDNPCEKDEFMVKGCWRVGNSIGQGRMQIIER